MTKRSCKQCGQEVAERHCSVCGHVEFQAKCVLIAQATSYRLEMRIDTDVGRTMFSSTGCGDYAFAAEPQFRISKDARLGGWAIEPDSKARNPTYLNANVLTTATMINTGDKITIGPSKMLLLVELSE
jgi:hypothetical protein